jgi:hypothetical protein
VKKLPPHYALSEHRVLTGLLLESACPPGLEAEGLSQYGPRRSLFAKTMETQL